MSDDDLKQYAVTLPVAGSVTVFVDAETEDEAVEKALHDCNFRVEGSDNTQADEDWFVGKYLLKGNISSAPCHEYKVEEQ